MAPSSMRAHLYRGLFRVALFGAAALKDARTTAPLASIHPQKRFKRYQLTHNGARASSCDSAEEARPGVHLGRLGRESRQGRIQRLPRCEDAHHGFSRREGLRVLSKRPSSRSCRRPAYRPGHGEQRGALPDPDPSRKKFFLRPKK